jgi:FKBP-type peptidyl-prolyl cis-trans isomerase (trigger factor)
VEDADIEAEIDAMAGSAGEQAEAIKALFANPGTRETLRHSVQTRKTIARLVGIASADSEASTATAAAKKPAAKPRRTAPRKAE